MTPALLPWLGVLQCAVVCCELCCNMLRCDMMCCSFCCSALQCDVVCCSVLQYIVLLRRAITPVLLPWLGVLRYAAVWGDLLQLVAVRCSVRRVAVCYSVLKYIVLLRCGMKPALLPWLCLLQCCNMLKYVAVCYENVLQCAVWECEHREIRKWEKSEREQREEEKGFTYTYDRNLWLVYIHMCICVYHKYKYKYVDVCKYMFT